MTVSEVLTGFFSIALAQSPGKPPDFNELHILNCKSFGKASTALIKVLFCIPASLAACRIVFASGTTSPATTLHVNSTATSSGSIAQLFRAVAADGE